MTGDIFVDKARVLLSPNWWHVSQAPKGIYVARQEWVAGNFRKQGSETRAQSAPSGIRIETQVQWNIVKCVIGPKCQCVFLNYVSITFTPWPESLETGVWTGHFHKLHLSSHFQSFELPCVVVDFGSLQTIHFIPSFSPDLAALTGLEWLITLFLKRSGQRGACTFIYFGDYSLNRL